MCTKYQIAITTFFLFALSNVSSGAVTQIAYQDFESGQLPNTNGWYFGSQQGGSISVSKDTSKNFAGSKGSLKGQYPIPTGGLYVWAGVDLSSLNTRELYIDLMAKMPEQKQGVKFVKVFGQRADSAEGINTANTTFGLDYTGSDRGRMCTVSFGHGAQITNDTQSIINFDNQNPSWLGRSYALGAVTGTQEGECWTSDKWGDKWHHFKIHIKYNSGTTAANEKPDGEYYVEIDGKVYVDAKGIFNRHYSNKPIQSVAFFDWSQGGDTPFELWYDNIRITTGGFYSQSPNPPKQN